LYFDPVYLTEERYYTQQMFYYKRQHKKISLISKLIRIRYFQRLQPFNGFNSVIVFFPGSESSVLFDGLTV